jgi:hypothetical protein
MRSLALALLLVSGCGVRSAPRPPRPEAPAAPASAQDAPTPDGGATR